MKKTIKKMLFFLTLFMMANAGVGCRGPTGPVGAKGADGISDRQSRLTFSTSLGSQDTAGFVSPENTYLLKFNKNYYVGVDSITFAGLLRTSSPVAYCCVELFDITDSVTIAGSLIQSNSPNYSIAESQNILNKFSNAEITLAVKIRSSKEGVLVDATQLGIYLYRK